MTPQELASLIAGIAETQAALLKSIEASLDKSHIPTVSGDAQRTIHDMIWQGQAKEPVTTFKNIAAKLLELAINATDDQLVSRTAIAEVSRLLGKP